MRRILLAFGLVLLPHLAAAQAWTAPVTWTTGQLVNASDLNAQIRDNELVLRAGGLSVTSQAIGDLLCASSTTQFARLADVATGNVLKSGGVGACPTYGQIAVANLSDASNVALLNAANTFTVTNTATTALAVRYNGTNSLLGFTIGNANGFVYLGNNTKSQAGSDTPVYDITGVASQLRLDSGALTFNYASSGTAGNPITWTQGFAVSNAGVVTLSGVVKNVDGSVSAPSVSFTNDTAAGVYRLGSGGGFGLAVNGQLFASVYLSNNTFKFEMADRLNGTGAVAGNSVIIGKNSSGNTAAGYLALQLKTSGTAFVWSDTTGVLRIGTAGGPTENNTSISDTSGTVVGSQTSTLDTKLLIAPFTDTRHALDVVAGAPLWRFTYKRGIGGEFVGVLSNTTPEVMMDPSPEHPEGRSFSPISAFGYTAAAIAELRQELQRLQHPLWVDFSIIK